jgi:hypothetical protein
VRSTKLRSSIERLLGAGAVAPPPYAFGCSDAALSFAAFGREDGALVLREYRREALEPGTFQHGLLGGPPRDPGALDERIAELVASLAAPVKEAALVVPDAWLRTAFAEVEDIPANGAGREEVLRWKLKRLVPFRVDELRVRAVEVTPLAGQEEARRLLLGFGIESLLAQLERSFEAAGVHLGRISNRGLAALGALAAPAGEAGGPGLLRGLVLAADDGYTVVFARRGPGGEEPVLHRFKAFAETLPRDARAAAVRRDLRLTRLFLADQYPNDRLDALVLAAPEGAAATWAEWLEGGLEHPVTLADDAPVVAVRQPRDGAGAPAPPPWPELLPLAGTVRQEVAG